MRKLHHWKLALSNLIIDDNFVFKENTIIDTDAKSTVGNVILFDRISVVEWIIGGALVVSIFKEIV